MSGEEGPWSLHGPGRITAGEHESLSVRARSNVITDLRKAIFGVKWDVLGGVRTALNIEPPRDPSWVPLIAELLPVETQPTLHFNLVQFLARIQSEDGIPTLISELKSPNPKACYWAAWGLGTVRATQAVPSLVPLLKHPATLERAAEALTRIGDPAGVAAVERCRDQLDGSQRKLLDRYLRQVSR